MLQRQPGQQLDRETVLEILVLHMPQENYERVFDIFIGWARSGELFAYDEATEMVSLG
jgi:NitT/TauT family transport system ATP-binding protein